MQSKSGPFLYCFVLFQLHLEWKVPASITGSSHAGSIYKQSTPLVNAMKKPGKWNAYDIIYKASETSGLGNCDPHHL